MTDDDSMTEEQRQQADDAACARERAEQDGTLPPTKLGRLNSPIKALPYRWRQTLQDVDITVPLPRKLRGRDLNVVIQRTKLVVQIKGEDAIVEVPFGTLPQNLL